MSSIFERTEAELAQPELRGENNTLAIWKIKLQLEKLKVEERELERQHEDRERQRQQEERIELARIQASTRQEGKNRSYFLFLFSSFLVLYSAFYIIINLLPRTFFIKNFFSFQI